MKHRYWLSFCDPSRPEGSRFVGVAVVESEGIQDAIRTAWVMGCNPGGQVQVILLPALDTLMPESARLLSETPHNVLLSYDDLERLGHVNALDRQ